MSQSQKFMATRTVCRRACDSVEKNIRPLGRVGAKAVTSAATDACQRHRIMCGKAVARQRRAANAARDLSLDPRLLRCPFANVPVVKSLGLSHRRKRRRELLRALPEVKVLLSVLLLTKFEGEGRGGEGDVDCVLQKTQRESKSGSQREGSEDYRKRTGAGGGVDNAPQGGPYSSGLTQERGGGYFRAFPGAI